MKFGGNAAASTALQVPIGGSSATASKYSSKVAVEYKNRLAQKAKLDQKRSPANPFVDPVKEEEGENLLLSDNDAAEDEPMADAISDDEPVIIPVAPPKSSLGLAQAPISTAAAATSNAKKVAGGGKLSKFGAVKSSNLNFDQLEARAKEEQALHESLGISFKTPQAEKIESRKPSISSNSNNSSVSKAAAVKAPKPPLTKDQEAALGRLGMGMKRVGPTTANVPDPLTPPAPLKSVSSDRYFRSASADEDDLAQQKERLHQLKGATSVSSSHFFADNDHPGDEDSFGGGGGTGGGGSSSMLAFARGNYSSSIDCGGGDGILHQTQRAISLFVADVKAALDDLSEVPSPVQKNHQGDGSEEENY